MRSKAQWHVTDTSSLPDPCHFPSIPTATIGSECPTRTLYQSSMSFPECTLVGDLDQPAHKVLCVQKKKKERNKNKNVALQPIHSAVSRWLIPSWYPDCQIASGTSDPLWSFWYRAWTSECIMECFVGDAQPFWEDSRELLMLILVLLLITNQRKTVTRAKENYVLPQLPWEKLK